MKRILFCLLVMVAQAAFAQDSGTLNAGTNFVHSIAPTSSQQVINPGAVNANAWSGNTSTPTAVPTGLGGFSSPKNDVSVYNSARTGGLTSLGNKAQTDCQNFTPGNDPLRNQECAAVNFLSNKCIRPSSKQANILGSLGSSQATNSADCEGTYGQDSQQFNFKDQITEQDSIFDSMRNLNANAAATAGQICTEKTVIIEPAKFDINTCLKTSITDTVSCSQYLNMSVTTTKATATVTNSCNDGTLVGAFCQKSSSGAASPIYVCPAGQSLSGSYCIDSYNISTPAIIAAYSCPSGQFLSGSYCVQTTSSLNPAPLNYSCPGGATLSGSNCVNTSYAAGTPNYVCTLGVIEGNYCNTTEYSYAAAGYSCPYFYLVFFVGVEPYCLVDYVVTIENNTLHYSYVGFLAPKTCPPGQTLSGSTCISTITTTTLAVISSYSCPYGGTVSGSNCITTSSTAATVSYSCPYGQALSGSNCTTTTTTTSPATPVYSCPAGSTLSGSNCISAQNVITPASVSSYSCPGGTTLSGTSCITVVTTPAIINYSCVDGSAPVAGICFYRSVNTSWTNTCGPLENSAGVLLGTPK